MQYLARQRKLATHAWLLATVVVVLLSMACREPKPYMTAVIEHFSSHVSQLEKARDVVISSKMVYVRHGGVAGSVVAKASWDDAEGVVSDELGWKLRDALEDAEVTSARVSINEVVLEVPPEANDTVRVLASYRYSLLSRKDAPVECTDSSEFSGCGRCLVDLGGSWSAEFRWFPRDADAEAVEDCFR